MLERNLFVLASQIFIDSHRQIRLPRHIADTEIQSFTVIISSHPCRKCTIICTATPFSCFIIQPECTFRSMTGSQHRHFTCRSDRINFSYSLCGYYQLICQSRHLHFLRRSGLGSVNTHKISIVHTIKDSQSTAVHPVIPHDSVGIRCSARINGRYS
jgi:hypothetical protein